MVYPKIQAAVKSAFKMVKGPDMQPQQVPEPLKYYNQLKPHDFSTLIQKHGEGKVLQFIKDMEALRSTTNDNP